MTGLISQLVAPLVEPLIGQSADGPFAPNELGQSTLLQWAADGTATPYSTTNVANVPVLRSRELSGTHRQPRSGRCFLFDGTDDVVTVGDTSDNALTISMWIKFAVDDQEIITLQNSTATAVDCVAGTLTFGGSLTVGIIYVDGVVKTDAQAGALLNDNAWHHLAFTLTSVSASNVKFATDSSAFGNLSMRDARIYNVAKSAAEITAIYNGDDASRDTTGLVARYLMNEESGLTAYDSYGTNHGVITGATLSTFHATDTGVTVNSSNQVGHSGALYFDGTDDYITVSDSDALDITEGTIAFWLLDEGDGASHDYIIDKQHNDKTGYYVYRTATTRTLTFGVPDGVSWLELVSTGATVLGEWSHWVLTHENGSQVAYKNGVATGTSSHANALGSNAQDLTFAVNRGGVSNIAGALSDVRIYSSVLTAAEVLALYGGTDPSASPVGHWKLNDGTGTKAVDSSSNLNHGTLTGGPVWHVIPRDESDTANDIRGVALDHTGKAPMPVEVAPPVATFDGTNDYVIISDSAELRPSGSWSASIWFNLASLPTAGQWYCLLGKGNASETSGQNHSWSVIIENAVAAAGPAINSLYEDSSGANTNALYDVTLTTSKWYHAVGVHDADADTLTLYLDGVSVVVNASATATPDVSTANVVFGTNNADSPSNYITGRLADARFYSDALTADEVTYLYSQGASGTDPTEDNLVGHWPLQEGQGDTCYDVSGNDNHGTVTNATLSNFWANTSNQIKDLSVERGGGQVAWFDGTDDVIDIGATGASATSLTFSVRSIGDNQELFSLQSSTATAVTVVAGVLTFGGSLTVSAITVDGVSKNATEAGALINDNTWHTVVLTLTSVAVNDLQLGFDGGTGYGNIELYNLQINSAGADGLWLLDGNAKDTSGNNNHGVITGTVFPSVPALSDNTLPIGGTPAVTRTVGKLGNPFSVANFNSYTAAELNQVTGLETAYSPGDARQPVATVDTKFRRSGLSGARDFEADNSEHFTIADNASLSTGDIDFTIAGWVYLESIGASRTIAAKRQSAPVTEWQLEYSHGDLLFKFTDVSAGVTASTIGSPVVNKWYFVLGWHDADASTINIQVNNTTVDSGAEGGFADTASEFNIGAIFNGTVNFWDGRIARVGFWKRTLTAAERTSLYNSGEGLDYRNLGAGLKTNLISYWDLNEASGDAIDSHSTNDLTDTNTVTAAEGPDRSTTGDDRFIATSAALTGGQKTNTETYVK